MTALGKYIAGRGPAPKRRELNRTIERWEWFTTARRARALITGDPDPALVLPLMFWPTVEPRAPKKVSIEKEDLIDKFIAHGGYRIVPDDDVSEVEVEVDIDIDPQMVTPQLAEIYRAQGLTAEAEKIDRILKGKQ